MPRFATLPHARYITDSRQTLARVVKKRRKKEKTTVVKYNPFGIAMPCWLKNDHAVIRNNAGGRATVTRHEERMLRGR